MLKLGLYGVIKNLIKKKFVIFNQKNQTINKS